MSEHSTSYILSNRMVRIDPPPGEVIAYEAMPRLVFGIGARHHVCPEDMVTNPLGHASSTFLPSSSTSVVRDPVYLAVSIRFPKKTAHCTQKIQAL